MLQYFDLGIPSFQNCCDVAGAAKRSYPTSKVRGGGPEEQPLVKGAVAAQAQEVREELLHVQGQEGRR